MVKRWRVVFASAVALAPATLLGQRFEPSASPAITFTPFHASGVYRTGERVGWIVRAPLGISSPPMSYVIRENNSLIVKEGAIDLSSGAATIECALDHPGMLYVRLSPPDRAAAAPAPSAAELAEINAGVLAFRQQNARFDALLQSYPNYSAFVARPSANAADLDKLTVAAAVAPFEIRPDDPRPADFDAFWGQKLAAQKQVLINARVEGRTSTSPSVDLSVVTLDSLGSQVHGYLAKPAGSGKFPALVIFQYAGVYALDPSTSTARATEGWLTFNVQAHDMAPEEATAPPDYYSLGNTDRETSYFLSMYLRDSRAIDYIRSRADWDGKTIVLMGGSQGGQQSLVTAALNPSGITAVIVSVPAGADMNGNLHHRQVGFPGWTSVDPKINATSRYFDVINFATHIRAASLVAFGFIDTTSPPAGILTAFNLIPGPKETVMMINSDHNHITPEKQDLYYARSREVLRHLLKTGRYSPSRH